MTISPEKKLELEGKIRDIEDTISYARKVLTKIDSSLADLGGQLEGLRRQREDLAELIGLQERRLRESVKTLQESLVDKPPIITTVTH